MNNMRLLNQNSVKSNNPWQTVIQTNYDIVKAHRVDLQLSLRWGDGTEMSIFLPLDPR
jgi:hypothetical protein